MPKLNPKPLGASLLLLGLLALSGCGSTTVQHPQAAPKPVAQQPVTQQPTSQQPASKASLGLYQLSLTSAQSGIKFASVQKVGAATQGLEVSGLSFKSSNYGTYVDQATGTLHLWATFDVTNNSAQAITAPTFIPVATTGSAATINGTAFKDLKFFDGSDASDKATSLSFDTPNDANAAVKTQLISNLDSGDVQINLPTGTQLAGISRSGWQIGTLAAGATGQVTLAASIPQASNPSQNPFSFSLVFTVADSVPTASITNLGTVQGSTPAGDKAGLSGNQTVSGVVTAVTPGLSGFFMQEQTINADKDGNTSDGIFVYCAANCPSLSAGDLVKVSGTVTEYGGVTQITAPTITKQNSGLALPAPVGLTLPLDTKTLERYEGMRVAFPETLTVTNNYGYGRYGELELSNAGRQFVASNGNAKAGQSTIILDDGISAQNPLNLNYLSSENTRRTGDTVTGLTGVWHSMVNTPLLEPEGPVNFVSTNPRPTQPAAVGGTLRVAGANLLNFFTTFTDGRTFDGKTGQGCAISGAVAASNCRGADNLAEFQRQRAKMAQTVTTLNPDVLTVMETQNDDNVTINEIVRALNEKASAGTFAAVQTGVVGSDAIRVGIIYKPAKVTPIGTPMIDTNSVYSRPPVAQTFQDKGTGGVFTVVANHLKSKGSCPSSGDTDSGQGCWNNLRVQQAQALLKFVTTVQQKSGDQDVLLLGDFNAYGAEDPIKTIQAGGFESLNLRLPADERYSFQFGGLFGYLDHALASPSLGSQVSGITEWHINSDEPTIADYNTEYKAIPECSGKTCVGKDLFDASNPFRASDHDPVLVGLNLTPDSVTTPTPSSALNANPSTLTVSAGGAALSSTLSLSTQNYSGADLKISTSNAAGLSVTPSVTTSAPNGTLSITVSAPAGTAAGSYPVTVSATGDGGLSTSATITVTVTSDGTTPPTNTNHLLISQVYGGGGNSGATYANDFVELFNPTASDINLSGYTLEYFSKAGGSGGKMALSGTIKAGGYFLVQQSSNAAVGAALPTPDAAGSLALSATDGSVALSSGAGTVDLVGYGAATKFEGAATAALSATKSAQRPACSDTDNNKADFTVTLPAPRNSSSAPVTCQ